MQNPRLRPLFVCGIVAALHAVVAAQDLQLAPSNTQNAGAPAVKTAELVKTLKAAGPNAATLAGPATAAAIKSLGREASPRQIGGIVYAVVRVVPNSAITIVRAAVAVAPAAAPEIAAAAASAVPNPWKEVRYQNAPAPQNPAPSSLGQEPDFKSSKAPPAAPPGIFDSPEAGTAMSLAEAIVQAAADTAGGGREAIQAAVDSALFGDPGQLFNLVSGSKGISGVGTAGNSNYANEPTLSGPTPTGTTGTRATRFANPPAAPTPAPVSP